MTDSGSSQNSGRGSVAGTRSAFLPPRWFIRLAWRVHRAIYRTSDGRRGLRTAEPGRWGTMHVTTTGRLSGNPRPVILAYLEDGPNLVTMAMNGWGEAEPAWWLNLQADPRASVRYPGGVREVRARAATGAEHDRLWARWQETNRHLDDYARRRPGGTAVVILEPVP